MSRSTPSFGRWEEKDEIRMAPFSLPAGYPLNPLLFTTREAQDAGGFPMMMHFTFFPCERGVQHLVWMIKERFGHVVKYEKGMNLQEGNLITLINTPYLTQVKSRRIGKLLLPNDSFDMTFIMDMLLTNGENTIDLEKYRLTHSSYVHFSANDILLQKISWEDLVKLEVPPPAIPWNTELIERAREVQESSRVENHQILLNGPVNGRKSPVNQPKAVESVPKSPVSQPSATGSVPISPVMPVDQPRAAGSVPISPVMAVMPVSQPKAAGSVPKSPVMPVDQPRAAGRVPKSAVMPVSQPSATESVPKSAVTKPTTAKSIPKSPVSKPGASKRVSQPRAPTTASTVHTHTHKSKTPAHSPPSGSGKSLSPPPADPYVFDSSIDLNSSVDDHDIMPPTPPAEKRRKMDCLKLPKRLPRRVVGGKGRIPIDDSPESNSESEDEREIAGKRIVQEATKNNAPSTSRVGASNNKPIQSTSANSSSSYSSKRNARNASGVASTSTATRGSPPRRQLRSSAQNPPSSPENIDEDEFEVAQLAPVWDSSDSDHGGASSPGKPKNKKGKKTSRSGPPRPFSIAERQDILNVILKYDVSQFVMGYELWNLLNKYQLFNKNWPTRAVTTLQSVFRKQIIPDLEGQKGKGIYRCSPADFKRYLAGRKTAELNKGSNTITKEDLERRIRKVEKQAKKQ